MTAKNFASWLRLLDVAWRALDDPARLTLNDLVRISLAEQPLPDNVLALEILEDCSYAAPISLSGMLAGWSASDQQSDDDKDRSIGTLKPREAVDNAAELGTCPIIASTTNGAEEIPCAGQTLQQQTIVNVEDGLLDDLEDLDFDECLI